MVSATERPKSRNPEPHEVRSRFLVSNIHCASCVTYVKEVLSLVPSVRDVDVSIITNEVRAYHGVGTPASKLAGALIQAAFEVHHITTYDDKGAVVWDQDVTPWPSRSLSLLSLASQSASSHKRRESVGHSRRKQHIANCDACKKEETEKQNLLPSTSEKALSFKDEDAKQVPGTSSTVAPEDKALQKTYNSLSTLESGEAAPPTQQPDEFIARVSIGGMSCASCANSITNEIKQMDFVKDITVTLLTNSATVTYTGPRSNAEKIAEQIEDIGFEASVDEVNQVSPPENTSSAYVTEIAIVGMTCGSCVGTVTRGLEELPFVTNVTVNLLSHSGKVEFRGQDNIDAIVEKIEDLGYDATVNSVHPLSASCGSDSNKITTRTVSIQVEGMFCHHCPEKVIDSLNSLGEGSFVIDEQLSVNNPIIKVTYTPNPPSFTIRNVISAIEGASEVFKATVYHPPSIEDRSRAMQQHERRRLLSRLIFVFAVAIPTFLIGIVFMSLASSHNSARKYLEQPMWAGNVSRMEWALFIMTTPVMFYGTDVFHTRAAKEVYALWRRGSRVPVWRRFVRFGSMNLLISAGTMVAYLASLAVLIIDAVDTSSSGSSTTTYFDSVVFLTLFILAGRFLEAYSKSKTGDAVSSLGKLRPSEALLVESFPDQDATDKISRVSVEYIEVGDIVSIPHGASPPADGLIVGEGNYQFDESSLTGESRPVKKSTGEQVFTGSVNVEQPVRIQVSEIGGSSMLDRIIDVVREGQSKRAPVERIADALTAHFVPIITLIAVSTFVIWLALGESGVLPADYLDVAHGGWAFWSLEFAVAVFVVACPCGLALAAPTALFVGGGLAAKYGILVKGGGEAFQEASRLNAIVFDKTGTLTEGGSLKVSDHEVLAQDAQEVQVAWTLAAKLEESSNHPVARAIHAFCSDKSSTSVLSSDIQEISGQGMKGTFSLSLKENDSAQQQAKYEAAIGNQRLLESLVSPDVDTYYLTNLLSQYQSAGKSTAILLLRRLDPESPRASKFTPTMVFATSDTIRPEAVDVISQLHSRKVQVYMCTGDNQTTAHAVADMLGISRSNVMANVMPAEKAEFVRQVQGNDNHPRKIVAFVGDGINDSPALAAADVSIAMASGSDVAINSASFVLLNSDLSTILQLVVLSRRVFTRVKMNFAWALVYNVCLVPVSAGVFYPIVSGHKLATLDGKETLVATHWRFSPVWAALAMALSSISVVTSSLALRIEWRSVKKIFGAKRNI
ncbi:hypothetical protein ASPZODRAFT_144862 [Penicilliopsis zonata CBS 506.65]|uniref:HMA domain-containing protein n=1 Tax=Penicilliopsis zonata CBS 506.65 TaxID=1073090 RepID=A0A1L9SAT3_9EURO|nr:hypothetical protein ASPZODRAFT_144862 [Penicilliopsis zonata CBS 506.65]OJJ44290.1 hypothetical protein ASPZODRAFT_144862 [Penicilliopsis zonata CBS 506.65]